MAKLLALLCLIHHSCMTIGTTESSSAMPTDQIPSSDCVSCPNSRFRQRSPEDLQRDKLRFEQDKILSKLKLQRPPNVHVTMNDLPSPLLHRLKADNEEFEKSNAKADSFYARSHFSHEDGTEEPRRLAEEEEDRDDLSAKTKGVYIFSQRSRSGDSHSPNCPHSNGRTAGCLDFKLNAELFSRFITSASLWVYKTLADEPMANLTLEIVEIHRPHPHSAAHTELWVADVPIDDSTDGWLEIDLTDHINRWHRQSSPADNGRHKRLRISCNGCSASSQTPIALDKSKQPFLEVKLGKRVTTRSGMNRGRRSSNECSPHLYSNCCLKPFYVNFTEIGWNSWILQPPGYYANYCTGSCRMTSTTSYNSIIRNVGNTKEARGEVIDQELVPCCAPTKMMGLSLLYAFSPGEIMKKTLDNMIVESCGC